ncbi:DNA damage-regulated autophagy modulator protein 1 [Echeneis naucrates]|uniref:CWH43-like N-terminal domain-containing protein n=1 Tax=Echeneis naucrates TaxID=173247 RepID=A0A665W221_ECHNA|nr:DNA damage-regulated autophagy modulator protein 1 [Echeneis naucrates]
MFWFMQGLCFLPVLLVICSSSTFIISYVIAVFRKDVDVIFPYISDTGALPPESCIFGLMTFISACAGAATIYARYKFVEKLIEDTSLHSSCLNKVGLGLGLFSCFCMCIVATFQELTLRYAHDAGALLFFLSGVSYIIVQSVLSYWFHPFGCFSGVFQARVGLSVLATLALFPTVICAIFVEQTKLHRESGEADYPYHLASAVCEWVTAFSFIFFFLTYIDDFKLFTLQVNTEFQD